MQGVIALAMLAGGAIATALGAGPQAMTLEEELALLDQTMAEARARWQATVPQPIDPLALPEALAARLEAVALEVELVNEARASAHSELEPLTMELARRLAAGVHLPSEERLGTWLTELEAFTPRLLELNHDPLFHYSAEEMIRFYERNDLPAEAAFWLEAIADAPSTTRREQLGALAKLTHLAYPSNDPGWPANTGLNRSVDDIMNWFTRYDEVLESARADGAIYEPSHDAYYDDTLCTRANLLDKHVQQCLAQGDPDFRRLDDLAELAVEFHEDQAGWVRKSQDAGRRLDPGKLSEWSAKSARSQARLSNLYARAGRPIDAGRARAAAIEQLDLWLSMNGDNNHRSLVKKDLLDLYWQADLAPAELLRLVEPHLLEVNEHGDHMQSIYQWLNSGVFADPADRARLADLFVYNFQERKTPEKLARNVYYSFGLVESAVSRIQAGDTTRAWERFDELVQLSKGWPPDRLDLIQSTFNRLTGWESRLTGTSGTVGAASSFVTRAEDTTSKPPSQPLEQAPAETVMVEEREEPPGAGPVTTRSSTARSSWYAWIPAGLIGVALVGFLARIAIRSR